MSLWKVDIVTKRTSFSVTVTQKEVTVDNILGIQSISFLLKADNLLLSIHLKILPVIGTDEHSGCDLVSQFLEVHFILITFT